MSTWLSHKLPTVDPSQVPDVKAITEQLTQEFDIPTDHLKKIVAQFQEEMQKGLDREGATVAMIPSFVTGRPTGDEKGKYLALDLGGTNLRVCQFELLGQGEYKVHQQKYVVSDELKTGEMRHLCDFIADCVDNFVTENGSNNVDSNLQLGFTFSFPVLQTDINRGTLMHWTKGFKCTGAVDKDVVVLLQDAFLRKNLNVHIAAIVNDTVGTLMAHAYKYPETSMGVILGTGTNACYYEKLTGIKKWKGGDTVFEEMVVNMEWGAFDNERRVLPLTIYDNKLDRESINPGEQMFEKMISGMYLGEIARNTILMLVDRLLLFKGDSSHDLNTQWRFETAYMSTIGEDTSADLKDTKHVLEEILQIPSTTKEDRQIVKHICFLVGQRAARLAACGIASVLQHTGESEKKSVVAIDGSVYEFYPDFEQMMTTALKELFGDDIVNRVKFDLARDGSGFGAAMVAMMSHKASQVKQSTSA
ncbi:hexokinase-domain-containing protein [Radiomyces spectabilis]|uniref:hexokinase-domain-containing protein n=1 Tax=Radiomyces spectabilis TaxID=64574 RepID=UPI00221F63D6|nr:hexokinase-domain-containing protein [Radiomyces spectabilis]KAI8384512.1 hexokinase-domain-containing protein [Radiomyces spectabilis]